MSPARKGFTLVEIIVVTGILSLLLSFVLRGSFSLSKATRLKLAAEKLAAELRLAQNLAMTSGKNQAVTIKEGKIVFASSGFPTVGSKKSFTIKQGNKSKRIIISSVGRIRIE